MPTSGFPRTWHVDRSVGGDFRVLQGALDAAASGDTIIVAPGRYDEIASYGPPNPRRIYGYIDIPVITIIGSGSGTIIGSEEAWDISQGQIRGLEVSPRSSILRVQNLVVENCEVAIAVGYGDSLFVSGCQVHNSKEGITTMSLHALIKNVTIRGILRSGYGVLSYFADKVQLWGVDSCTGYGGNSFHFQVEGPSHVIAENCQFAGGTVAIGLSLGPRADVRQCEFANQSYCGIGLGPASPVCTLSDCTFHDQYIALSGSQFPGSRWYVDRVIFDSVSHSTLDVTYLDDGYFRNCQLASGQYGVVSNLQYHEATRKKGLGISHFDMRNNWWGTTDTDSVASMIFDHNDQAEVPYIIDFIPVLKSQVDTEKESLGGIKSLFRN